jgi:hypothetical protein
MATYSLKLWFRGGDVDRDQLPGAVAHIAVKHATTTESDDEVFVSHLCMGPSELKAEVDRLKAELDSLLAAGNRKFADYERTTRDKIKARRNS